ncbi:MAG: hypothetical protein QOI29_2670 [Mycobacterium sp.]|jgi:hypothetical protein|nr:hypothetical protein [Mycobacterium sp.]
MTTTDRQASGRELLDEYRRLLASAGGPDLDRDELWDRYRQRALYAYVAALITAGMGGMQAEDIALEGLRRSVARWTTSTRSRSLRSLCDRRSTIIKTKRLRPRT